MIPPPIARRIRMVSVVLALLYGTCASLAADDVLTINETLGAVFLRVPRVNALANPDAKPLLYRLLDNKQIEEHHAQIYSMLGYIGNETDATNLAARLRSINAEVLSRAQWSAVQSILWSLSIMADRGSNEASQILKQMTQPDYWQDIRFQSIEGINLPHSMVNEMTIWTLLAYARSGAEDWSQTTLAFKASIPDPTVRNTIEWRLDPKRVTQHVKEFREKKTGAISPETRKLLAKAFNGDFNKPGLTPIEVLIGTNNTQHTGVRNVATNAAQALQGANLVAFAKEARVAFKRIMENFLNDQYEECAKTLADNGKPLLPMEKQSGASIADMAQKFKTKSRDTQVTKTLLQELRAQDINFGEAQGEAFSDGKVVIKIPCLGSGEVKNRHLARHHETRTTDSQGQLVIYMIKQDGQWFWNPFGW